MIYLIKANRDFTESNHQYIIGIHTDEDIAHFMGRYHCKFYRANKYNYSIEAISWATAGCYIVSWENEDESLRYNVFAFKELSNCPQYAGKKYRFRAEEYENLEISEEDLLEAARYWHFFEGKEVLGLSKLYEEYRKKKLKEHREKRLQEKEEFKKNKK